MTNRTVPPLFVAGTDTGVGKTSQGLRQTH